MGKRVLSMVLSALLVTSCFPAVALADLVNPASSDPAENFSGDQAAGGEGQNSQELDEAASTDEQGTL